jgi:hypothetical protein
MLLFVELVLVPRDYADVQGDDADVHGNSDDLHGDAADSQSDAADENGDGVHFMEVSINVPGDDADIWRDCVDIKLWNWC